MVPLLVRLVTVQSPVSFQMQPSPMGFSGICPSGASPLGASSISRRSVSELSFISRTSPLMTVYSLTAAAIVFCTLMTYMLLRLFSRRAIDPVVRSAEQQKQFITDAGHELKTPLTVITTCLSVLEMETGKNKWIDKIQAQTDKMRDLVNDLVTLSRMDEERPPVIMADFDISAAVAETADSFADSAQAAGLTLEQDIESGLSYHGDEAQIRQLCSILLDNAVKYALDTSPVRIGLKKEKSGIVLRCSNACAELPQEELNKLFDRFYRPDKSRSSETGGFGIGLSIARSIAQAHRGTIKAAAPQPGIIEFTAILK